MLQKILVILVGLFMSIVGALAPNGSLFASQPGPDAGLGLSAGASHEETLATVRTADGEAFARLGVLWAEVDGRRVTDDAWGTGQVQELKLKVGTRDVEGLALAIGSRVVALHPTDVLTIRMFEGEFAYRGMGGPGATVQLQGTVKTTLVSQGGATQRVQTQAGQAPAPVATPQAPPADGKLAYVVLDTGARVDTVAVEKSASRFYTEEAASAQQHAASAGNLLARYVKIDGRMVKEYTAGEGPLESIEFQPAQAQSRSGVVAFDGKPTEVSAQTRVLVKDFVGEYLVYQVGDGLVRLRLDGYAGDMLTGDAASLALPQPLGGGAPNVAFEFSPLSPTTSDAVQFRDRSVDDGYVVFRQWDFGDGRTTVVQDPSHTFALPGVYEVRLNVTDNDLNQREVRVPITVRNSNPVPDFEYAPKRITTDTLVSFTDYSNDVDGSVVNWTWDFGDGGRSHLRHPTHKFASPGNATVTLTVVDTLGGQRSISKVVVVLDTPPVPEFDWTPKDAQTLLPIQFLDQSLDRDGVVVAWNWSFGDGSFGSGSAPTHAFPRPGVYTVSMTAFDDRGAAATVSHQVIVQNRPPIAQFTWNPYGSTAEVPVTFTSTSHDPDGLVLLTQWDFGDGSSPSIGPSATHSFPRAGLYNVTMTVSDGITQSSLTRSVPINNSAPRASLSVAPNPAFRHGVVLFADTTSDLDGDAIVERLWSFGDGGTSTVAFPNHTYATLGSYPITLQVKDSAGLTGFASTTLNVVNRPPIGSVRYAPAIPIAGQPITFEATGSDPDDPTLAAGPLTYEWRFSDGGVGAGPQVTRTFPEAGLYQATLLIHDAEGGVSIPLVARFAVDYPDPVAVFSHSPTVPAERAEVAFTDASTSLNGAITAWNWDFGDGVSSLEQHPRHAFTDHRTYVVTLTVTDVRGRTNVTNQSIIVNGLPTASFEMTPATTIATGTTVQFTDRSVDPEQAPLARLWTFGDTGATSTLANPARTFTTPGQHEVTLTVTDPHGATATTSKVVVVADRAPTAGFVVTTGSPTAGQAVGFEALGYSHDPDGDSTIQSYAWSFGDAGRGTGHNPTHTYANSGVYLVSLTVSDGILQSAPFSRNVRVGSDHAVTIRVHGNLPASRVADLTDSHYEVGVRFRPIGGGSVDYVKGQLTPVGNDYDLTFQPGQWVAGDSIVVSVRDDRWMGAPVTKSISLADADGRNGPVLFSFDLAMPLVPTLDAKPGEAYLNVDGDPVPGLGNATVTPDGHPVYRTSTERFHGNGTVVFLDGVAARGAQVIVEARYVPVNALAPLRDGLPNNFALGWCRAMETTTDADGRYAWTFSGADCLASSMGVFPVGRWEVRARAVLSFATVGETDEPHEQIVVDPTGGLLWPYAGALP